jgi:hypothetical protein
MLLPELILDTGRHTTDAHSSVELAVRVSASLQAGVDQARHVFGPLDSGSSRTGRLRPNIRGSLVGL